MAQAERSDLLCLAAIGEAARTSFPSDGSAPDMTVRLPDDLVARAVQLWRAAEDEAEHVGPQNVDSEVDNRLEGARAILSLLGLELDAQSGPEYTISVELARDAVSVADEERGGELTPT